MIFSKSFAAAALLLSGAQAGAIPIAARQNTNTYTFEINAGQIQKFGLGGPSVNTAWQYCFVGRLTDQNGSVIAGAATKDDKDWVCAQMVGRPPTAIYSLKYSQVTCDRPLPIGGGVSFCTDGADGKTAHFPGFVVDGKQGWCVLQGDDASGYSSCTMLF
ncbi:hypothetical protein BGZ63DRAFT_425146 [Mariannaea sp. PMI_226]|nr:hypothetical protein BGZ63DRAFT_425146 [Mariannaea sp. PMI_226]